MSDRIVGDEAPGAAAEVPVGTPASRPNGLPSDLPDLVPDDGARDPAGAATVGEDHRLVLQVVQPGLLGLMDGSVSTLAPLFATAELTGRPHAAFYVGLAASVGAAISMGLAEALSDDGKVSGRGRPLTRGAVTAAGTLVGGMLHTLPFLLGDLRRALWTAYGVVIVELVAIAYIRFHYMRSPLGRTIVQVILGGAVVFGVGIWLGHLGATA